MVPKGFSFLTFEHLKHSKQIICNIWRKKLFSKICDMCHLSHTNKIICQKTDLTDLFLSFNGTILEYWFKKIYKPFFVSRDKLAPVKLNRYKDDVLFYMFYTNVGDVLQLAAAAEL